MKIIMKKLSELVPYKKNPRKNDAAVPKVMQSIKEFGFKVPIVIDKDNVLVTGHTRFKASKNLGLDEVPCIIADDLTDEQIKAYRLADNKVSEFSIWDDSFLGEELEVLEELGFDMTDFGFDMSFEEELEVEIPKEEKDDAESQITQEYLRYDDKKIAIAEDEIMQLNDKLKNYQDEFGTSYGFVRYLLDEIH